MIKSPEKPGGKVHASNERKPSGMLDRLRQNSLTNIILALGLSAGVGIAVLNTHRIACRETLERFASNIPNLSRYFRSERYPAGNAVNRLFYPIEQESNTCAKLKNRVEAALRSIDRTQQECGGFNDDSGIQDLISKTQVDLQDICPVTRYK